MKRQKNINDSIKGVFSIIARSKYKWWLFVLITLAIAFACISAFVTKSEMAEVFLMGILVSLFINLVSSFVTIIFIEERDQKASQQIEAAKQSIVIDRLILAIREYNDFFTNLYKATSVNSIIDLEERCGNIYHEIDLLVQHLNRLDFYKEGYMSNFQSERYKWHQIFIIATKKYIITMQEIQDNYLSHLTNINLIEPIKGIASLPNFALTLHVLLHNNVDYNQLMPKESGICLLYKDGIEIKLPYCILQTLDTIEHTKRLMAEIDRITKKSNFIIKQNTFTATNVLPKIGSAIDEKYGRPSST